MARLSAHLAELREGRLRPNLPFPNLSLSPNPNPNPEPEPDPDEGEGEEGEGGEGEGEGEDEEVDIVIPDPPKSKYAVDNNVVAVTYGESKVEIYKTLLLNFNDYTIQTTYNGVTYTIEAYDYVVIMH